MKFEIIESKIIFNAYIAEIGNLENRLGHFEYDAQGLLYSSTTRELMLYIIITYLLMLLSVC